MDKTSYELSIIAFYLSKYDVQAVQALKYKNITQAIKDISIKLGRENAYLKLRRDEFDALTDSPRKGFKNRNPVKDVSSLFLELSVYDFESLTKKVKSILEAADKETEERLEEQIEDKKFVEEVDHVFRSNIGRKNIANQPKPLKENEKKYYGSKIARDPSVAANALCNADFKCELCPEHKTFIRKSNGKPYTEPHHLIPMKFQKDFNVSIDVENNIVSLCSNCHNLLHYGADFESSLKLLYEKRKQLLKDIGVDIEFNELKKYY